MEDVPDELAAALEEAPDAAARFAALPPSHRRAYLQWVGEGKKAETRLRRAAKTIEMLRAR